MTTIESLNTMVELYLRGSTTRYIELGEYETFDDMLHENAYNYAESFIEMELIHEIAYSWCKGIYDIGNWRYYPMFRSMYATIIANPVLISHMNEFITTSRATMGRDPYPGVYQPVDLFRNYTWHYALSLNREFFKKIITEHFIEASRELLIFTRRRTDDSDDEVSDDDEDEEDEEDDDEDEEDEDKDDEDEDDEDQDDSST